MANIPAIGTERVNKSDPSFLPTLLILVTTWPSDKKITHHYQDVFEFLNLVIYNDILIHVK